ncbi:DUF3786 domain-containing protein [Candidatus Bathyarchaeota archaeon]|nr:DUF3786 domain-containing protein [Candidatus Bathyarchaeota archaeon]
MPTNPIELWTWRNCKEVVKSLPGRLGFPAGDKLEFLGLELDLKNGSIKDSLTGGTVNVNQREGRRTVNTIFYALSAYSESPEKIPTGKLISSKQFRGTQFTKRDTLGERDRITQSFEDPAKLETAATALRGSKVEFPYGDIAVNLNLLPFIPLTIVLAVDDGEFPGDARLFYDETVENYLDAEQTYFLTSLTVSRLIQSAGEL